MPITINGSGTVTGISAGGLPDGVITTDDIAASAVTSAKLAAGAGGKILQVVQAAKTDMQSGSAGAATWTDITGLSASITPSSASNKILVMGMVTFGFENDCGLKLVRGSTDIFIGDAAGSRRRVTTSGSRSPYEAAGVPITYLDSPATTASTTYKIQAISDGSAWYINGEPYQPDTVSQYRGASSLILMEVAA